MARLLQSSASVRLLPLSILSIALAASAPACTGEISDNGADPGEPEVFADAALPDESDARPADVDAAPQLGGTEFLLPWTGETSFRVSQGHGGGSHVGKGNYAWDFALPSGTPLRAAHDGVVRVAYGASTIGGCSSTYANDANYVVVDRGDGLESLYLHLTSTTVSAGDVITRGDVIGYSGETGWACGAHLHFQIQASPDGGGTQSWYNASVQEYFHDTGAAYDPPQGSEPVSANRQ